MAPLSARPFALALAFCSAFLAAAPAESATSRAAGAVDREAAGVFERTLPNGFKIILAPQSSASTVKISLTVRTGSMHEGYGETGMAHLLEHMLFKSAGAFPDIKAALTATGAAWNGTTTSDRTNYFETVKPDPKAVETLLKIQAARLNAASFTRDDLAKEMTVVRNELERGENSPSGLAVDALRRSLFPWHGYGRSTIGERSDIERAPFSALKAFYERHYRPSNAFLVVSGAFDRRSVLDTATALFSPAGRDAAPAAAHPDWTREAPSRILSRSEIRYPAGKTSAFAAWRLPPEYDRSTVALELGSAAACSQQWGSLRAEFVLRDAMADSASCSPWTLPQAGLLFASASAPSAADPEKLSDALASKLEARFAQGVDSPALERARAEELNAYRRLEADHEALHDALASAELSGDWRLFLARRRLVSEITPAEASKAMALWVAPANRAQAWIRDGEAAASPRLPEPASRAQAAEISAPAAASAAPLLLNSDPPAKSYGELAAKTVRLAEGPNALVALTRSAKGGLAWIDAQARYGDEASLAGKKTACRLAEALYPAGGAGFDRSALDQEMQRLKASQWSVGAGRVFVEAPRETAEEAFRLLLSVRAVPAFPADEFERLRSAAVASVDSASKDPAAVARREVAKLYDHYPEGHWFASQSFEAERAALASATLEQAKACAALAAAPNHWDLGTSGFPDAEAPRRLLKAAAAAANPSAPYERLREMAPAQPAARDPIVVERPAKPSATVFGVVELPFSDSDPDVAALRVAIRALGGDSDSAIWRRLREKDGLAYGAGAQFSASSFDPKASFAFFATAESSAADKALEALRQEIAKALADGFSDAAVAKAKDNLLAERAMAMNEEASHAPLLAASIASGRGFEWLGAYEAKLAAVTAKDASDALRRRLGDVPILWAVAKGSAK